jgi:histidinol-phosphate aminotransferase
VYRGADDIEQFLDLLPDDLAVLVDEAYYDFVDEADAGRTMSLTRERPNLLVTRTFSKAYGLCGLRIGYGVGSTGWIAALEKVRQPSNTNALAQAAALESLRHPAAIARRVTETLAERHRVETALTDLGVPFTRSQTNFILLHADSGTPDGGSLHEDLLRRGVIARDGAALGVPGTIRLTIGAPQENDAFLAALSQVYHQSMSKLT